MTASNELWAGTVTVPAQRTGSTSVREAAGPVGPAPSGATTVRALDLGSGLLALPVTAWSGAPVQLAALALLAWPLALLAARDTVVRRTRLRLGSPARAFTFLTAGGAVAFAVVDGLGLAHP